MKKKNTKRNIIILVLVLVVLVACVAGYVLFKDLKQEDILREEIKTIANKDVTKDRYNDSIKTKDDYAVVEKAIKEYVDNYAVTLQEVTDILEDTTLTNMLSADNYQKDGPDFNKSKEYLATTKKSLNDGLTKLSYMINTDAVMENIEDKNLEKYYNDLYKELMFNYIMAEKNFESAQQDLKTASDRVNNIIDVENQVIDLLAANKGKWQIKDGKIIFSETSVLNQYNELCKKLS